MVKYKKTKDALIAKEQAKKVEDEKAKVGELAKVQVDQSNGQNETFG